MCFNHGQEEQPLVSPDLILDTLFNMLYVQCSSNTFYLMVWVKNKLLWKQKCFDCQSPFQISSIHLFKLIYAKHFIVAVWIIMSPLYLTVCMWTTGLRKRGFFLLALKYQLGICQWYECVQGRMQPTTFEATTTFTFGFSRKRIQALLQCLKVKPITCISQKTLTNDHHFVSCHHPV